MQNLQFLDSHLLYLANKAQLRNSYYVLLIGINCMWPIVLCDLDELEWLSKVISAIMVHFINNTASIPQSKGLSQIQNKLVYWQWLPHKLHCGQLLMAHCLSRALVWNSASAHLPSQPQLLGTVSLTTSGARQHLTNLNSAWKHIFLYSHITHSLV